MISRNIDLVFFAIAIALVVVLARSCASPGPPPPEPCYCSLEELHASWIESQMDIAHQAEIDRYP